MIHLATFGITPNLAVDTAGHVQVQPQILDVGLQLVRGDHDRTQRRAEILALGRPQTDLALIALQIAGAPVIENRDIPMTDSEKERKIIRATALFLAANNLSLRIVTSDTFRDLLELASGLRSSYVMSSPSIRAETLNTYTELKQLL